MKHILLLVTICFTVKSYAQQRSGADSVITCQAATDTVFEMICNGDTVYLNNQPLTTTGWYTDTLTTVNGCDSIVTINLDVITPSVSAIGIPRDTFCSRAAAVTLSCQPAGGVFSGSGVVDSMFNPMLANLGNDTITYTVTDSGCSATSSLVANVVQLPAGIAAKVAYDTLGVNIFYTDTLLPATYVWQVQQYSGPDSVFTGDTFVTHCYMFAVRPVRSYDTLSGQVSARAIIYFYGCADTTAWVNTIGCEFLGGGIEDLSSSALQIFPNPTAGHLLIQTQNITPHNINIYNVQGRLISTLPYQPEIDISSLNNGIYFIELNSSQGVVRKKFVKM